MDPLRRAIRSCRPISRLCCACAIVVLTHCGATAQVEQAPSVNLSAEVRFTFERVPWRTVLDWLAEEAHLALHVNDLPTGSFTYSDTRAYTLDEAINRINLFLIPKRYTLVRSEKLLSVINLDDDRSVRQLDAIARQVDLQELSNLGPHDVVKCFLPLGEIDAELALQEISGMLLIREPVVLQSTNQLLVTETAGKMQTVWEVLQKLSNPVIGTGPVKQFPLGDLIPERVLEQVRPHVGLDPLAMTGSEINLSIDLEGNQLLATGSKDNLDAIAGVMEILKTSEPQPNRHVKDSFQTHSLGQADMQTVVSVLETLLADEDVRLAPDSKSNQLAVLGSDEVHEIVETTISKLTGSNAMEFKAISLRSADPRYVVAVLGQMFELQDGTGESNAEAPRVEADPFTARLFIRARPGQIAQIETAIEQIQQTDLADGSGILLLPYRGPRAKEILQSARDFWPHADELEVLPSSPEGRPVPLEREINPEPATEASPFDARDESARMDSPSPRSGRRLVARPQQIDAPAPGEKRSRLRVKWTERGILVQSDDPAALKRFESHLQIIAGPAGTRPHRLAVFYLKHTTVDEANRLLQSLLDAEYYASASAALLVDQSQPMLRDVLEVSGIGAASMDDLWTMGSATVIPDSRLNRLFVYGTADDLTGIERHLEVIDRENSIAQVKVFGTPRVVKLLHARAEQAAEIIRDAYAGRIAASTKERQQAAAQQRQQQQERNRRAEPDQDQQRAVTLPAQGQQPKFTLAVDGAGNALVITAPDQLAAQVEKLALQIDSEAAQMIQVETLQGGSTEEVYRSLSELLGRQNRAAPSRASSQ